MAFSLRKMLSNMYYKKSDETLREDTGDPSSALGADDSTSGEPTQLINSRTEDTEPDSTSKPCTVIKKIPDSIKFSAKNDFLSDNEYSLESQQVKMGRRKTKKLKLDVNKAVKSCSMSLGSSDSNNCENTPKDKLLDCKSSEIFTERLKEFDLDKSFDLFDHMSDGRPSTPSVHYSEMESLSDTDVSHISSGKDKSQYKMCRKVEPVDTDSSTEYELVNQRTDSIESFENIVLDKKEEDRISLLLSYQDKLNKLDTYLKQLLQGFQFHIEQSKVFHSRSLVSAQHGTEIRNMAKKLNDLASLDDKTRADSPDCWNIVLEKEDILTKFKLRTQLQSIKEMLDDFIKLYLKSQESKCKKTKKKLHRELTYDIPKQRRLHINKKKKRYNDYPDLEDALHNLFNLESDYDYSNYNDNLKCTCNCRNQHPLSPSQADSGVKEQDLSSHSITSSLGNFSLNTMTLSAYSECLDLITSFSSFEDENLFNTMLQKPAIDRITFYVQTHSIQLFLEDSDGQNIIVFFCPACKCEESEERGIVKHILSQSHCEKIHFLYKTAYIKKCLTSGKEIEPSTVLNPMRMYRDDNKIVCFGDAMYACSLCFDNLIIGESVLMAHCSEAGHVERRNMLAEFSE